MSIAALNWAWNQDCPSATAKLVLIALADRADDDGKCWPKMETVAARAGVSTRQVSRHLASLDDMGLIRRKRPRRSDGTLAGYTYWLRVGQETLNPPPDTGDQWTSTTSGHAGSSPPDIEGRDHRTLTSGQEPPVNPQGTNDGGSRRADLFEALLEVSGWDIDHLTTSARGRTNRAAKELDEIGASPEGVRARGRVHRRKWPDLDVTPTSIAANYALLGKSDDAGSGPSGAMPVLPSSVEDWDDDKAVREAQFRALTEGAA